MNWFDFPTVGAEASLLIALISIVFGLALCFSGYRLFQFMLGVFGFLLGAVAGFLIADYLVGGQTLWLVLGAILGGLVGAALFSFLYSVGVFLAGAWAGAWLANLAGVFIGFELPMWAVFVAAVALGIIALILQRAAIIVITAFGGAWAMVSAGAALFIGQSVPILKLLRPTSDWLQENLSMATIWVVWLALGIVGAFVQFCTTDDESSEAPSGEERDLW
jgi:hypothetical protein